MAQAMNLVHDQISTYLTDRMFRAQQAKACADKCRDPCGMPCLKDVHKCAPPVPVDPFGWIDELLQRQVCAEISGIIENIICNRLLG